MKTIYLLLITALLLGGCAVAAPPPTPEPATAATAMQPNPASTFCKQQGYRLEIRTAADGSQSGFCIFLDGSACDEWAYYRGECRPAGQTSPSLPAVTEAATLSVSSTATPAPAAIPTARPIDPADYAQGWWTYTHPVYGFSILLPDDWTVVETTASDPLMNGHLLMLKPENGVEPVSIRMTFRRVGEETRLWPTGVGQGEFIPQGTLEVAGQHALRVLLVCPSGEVTSIWYHQAEGQPSIARGQMEFGFIFSAGEHCQAGQSLGGKVQYVGEMIVASLGVP